MSKGYASFQNDVSSTANQLMTQYMCAREGMDYGQLMQTAQQAHLQNIMAQEQARQMSQMVNRHYNGTSIVSRIKDAIVGQPAGVPFGSGFPMTPMAPMAPMPIMPMPVMQQPQYISAPQPVQQAPIEAEVVEMKSEPVKEDNSRLDALEKQLADLTQMLMYQAQSAQQAPSQQVPAGYQGVPPFNQE